VEEEGKTGTLNESTGIRKGKNLFQGQGDWKK
jgi:hypothetical protein